MQLKIELTTSKNEYHTKRKVTFTEVSYTNIAYINVNVYFCFRYVTSFPVDANQFEPTSLPMSKSVGNIAEPNVVRLQTKLQEKDEKSQVHLLK